MNSSNTTIAVGAGLVAVGISVISSNTWLGGAVLFAAVATIVRGMRQRA